MIQIKSLCKAFGDRVLFENYSLEIASGEFIVFSGVSGCGKTTLLNMIGALEHIDSGEILVDEIDITHPKNQLRYFRYKVGFLFQNFALIENKTVLTNMRIVRHDNSSDISIDSALERVGLMDKRVTRPLFFINFMGQTRTIIIVQSYCSQQSCKQ